MIISFPSTIAISLFFIGWTSSPQKAAEIAPLLPLSVGIIMIFATIYIYLSRIKMSKIYSIIFSAIISLSVWILASISFALFSTSRLPLTLLGYIILTSIAYYFLTMNPGGKSVHKPLKFSIGEKIGRAAFAGFFIALAVFLSKTSGVFWGGIFSGFPAVYLSTLLIFHWHYDSSFLFKTYKNSPLGSIPLTVYPVIVVYAFPKFGIIIGTVLAYGGSLISFLILTTMSKHPKNASIPELD